MSMRSLVALARQWASYYSSLGYQPLPSIDKIPLVPYAERWESRIDPDPWKSRPAHSIQLMCGRYWNLAVIDLDGSEAIEEWNRLQYLNDACPDTWTVTTPSGGRHLWFSIPHGAPERGRCRLWGIWEPEANNGHGDWRKHTAIELLIDRCLITAPPSIRSATGVRYRFAVGPKDLKRPAPIPEWVIAMPTIQSPVPETPTFVPLPRTASRPLSSFPSTKEVIDAIPDKVAVARDWGLRFAARPRRSGDWVSVHDFNREDTNPSARFNVATGFFWRPGQSGMVGLLDLGVSLQPNRYRDWLEVKRDLISKYGVSA